MLDEVVYVAYSEEKLTELLLYVATQMQKDGKSGATKLNKYLYFADFAAMRRLGHAITGAEYQKLYHGPAPRRLRPIRERLVQAGDAVLDVWTDAFGLAHHDLVPQRAPRTDLFSAEELALVDEVIEELRHRTAKQVSDLSHEDAGWQLVGLGETIPYELAFVLAPDRAHRTPAAEAEGHRILAKYADRLA